MTNFVTAHNAAKKLGIARRTLLGYVAAGKITPAMKLDGRTGAYLFTEEQVDRLAAERREEVAR